MYCSASSFGNICCRADDGDIIWCRMRGSNDRKLFSHQAPHIFIPPWVYSWNVSSGSDYRNAIFDSSHERSLRKGKAHVDNIQQHIDFLRGWFYFDRSTMVICSRIHFLRFFDDDRFLIFGWCCRRIVPKIVS